MSRRAGARSRPRPKKVLVFGESDNDTKTIRQLLLGLWPDSPWTISTQRRPQVLIKDARAADVPSRVSRIAAVVRAEQVDSEVIAVFLHEDCDAIEPAHEALAEKYREGFEDFEFHVEPVVPAWEMESWLLQWPEVFPLVVQSWPPLDKFRGTRVGLIEDAKEVLTNALRASRSKRDYRESDAPAIAEKVVERGWARDPKARSDSYLLFVTAADRVRPRP